MTDVHWLEQTEADVPAADGWLSTSEAARLAGMRFARRRADWRLGRWTAKRVLVAYLKVPGGTEALAGVEIHAAPSGAPEVFLAGRPAPVTISISHRSGRAICAVAPAGAALGCDLEMVEPRSDAFVADYFTPGEQALVARASPADRPGLIALVWSGKESALKALREGLRLDTRCVAVSAAGAPWGGAGWSALRVCYAGGPVFQGWWQRSGDFVRTLVGLPPPHPPEHAEKASAGAEAFRSSQGCR